MLALVPVLQKRPRQAQAPLRLAGFDRPLEGASEVLPLDLELLEPWRGGAGVPGGAGRAKRGRGLGARDLPVRPVLGEDEAVGGVSAAGERLVPARLEPLLRVFADRLEQEEAGLPAARRRFAQEALVEERPEPVERVDAQVLARVADGLGGFQREASGEDGQAAEELCSSGESRSWLQSIAPRSVCCRAGRSRAPPVRSCSRCSSRASIAAGVSSLTRAAASSIARGRPSSRMQISAVARARFRRDREVRLDRRGALAEEGDRLVLRKLLDRGGPRVGQRQRRHRELVLAVNVERRPAGDEDLRAGAGRRELRDQRRRGNQVLEAVETGGASDGRRNPGGGASMRPRGRSGCRLPARRGPAGSPGRFPRDPRGARRPRSGRPRESRRRPHGRLRGRAASCRSRPAPSA